MVGATCPFEPRRSAEHALRVGIQSQPEFEILDGARTGQVERDCRAAIEIEQIGDDAIFWLVELEIDLQHVVCLIVGRP